MQLKWPMRWDLFSLFPAYAGVILDVCFLAVNFVPFPRIRGGDPNLNGISAPNYDFSPHTRG